MNKLLFLLLFVSIGRDTGDMAVVANLPKSLKEVSGIEMLNNSEYIWMLNDGGNKARLYGVNSNGKLYEYMLK